MSADTAGTDPSRFHEAYRDELRVFAGLLNGDDAPYPDALDGLRAQHIAAAAILSAAQGRSVAIEEVAR